MKIKFISNQKGATAIEYGLIAALIAVGIIVAAIFLGDENAGLYEDVSNKVKAVVAAALAMLN
ncbi:MAG: Flp family type IVb pilin [Devosiaceae bacterium]|nr:Flp family type IVb pilin [Devosiaceae bacterium]